MISAMILAALAAGGSDPAADCARILSRTPQRSRKAPRRRRALVARVRERLAQSPTWVAAAELLHLLKR